MSHGESQEKGQEESQEEVILLALCQRRARVSLARRIKFEDTARSKRAVSFSASANPFTAGDLMSSANMQKNTGKQAAAREALEFVKAGEVLGVGTGSTVNFLIEELAASGIRIAGAVSSSHGSTERLEAAGIPVLDLNEAGDIETYIDGADETNHQRQLIKGGGAALTREKIIAAAAHRFVCIADEAKLVDTLGAFPLPVEVIPMARTYVDRQLTRLGGRPVWREQVVTDNGNHILDVHGLRIADPVSLECAINQITGVVTVGLFAARPADVVILGGPQGTRRI
jgi:ribose 5-phosphate isomerase A